MKRISTIILALCLAAGSGLIAQAPHAFKYQTVVRNSSGDVITNKTVTLRLSVLQGSATGLPLFQEMHSVSTSSFGLVSVSIGEGTPISGSMTDILWSQGSYFLRVEIDPEGGMSFMDMGSSPLLSVPYALHANTVTHDQVNDADADTLNEIQTLSITGKELTLSKGGGTITVPTGDNWGEQVVVTDKTLKGQGTTEYSLGLGQNGATTGQVLRWSGTAWSPYTMKEAAWFKNTLNNLIYNEANNTGFPLVQITSPSNSAYLEINKGPGTFFAQTVYANNTVVKGLVGLDNNDNMVMTNGNYGLSIAPNGHADLVGSGHSILTIKAPTLDALININRNSGSRYSALVHQTAGVTNFYSGLIGTDNYQISASYTELNGLEVDKDGNVELSDNINITGDVTRPATGNANLVPAAYGMISSSGDVISSATTQNVSCTWSQADLRYELTLTDGVRDCIIQVTPMTGQRIPSVLLPTTFFPIYFYNLSADLVSSAFYFVVYKK